MSSKKNTSIVWFRNNLRIEDNSALYYAVNQSDRVIGYVNIDPNNFKFTQYGFKKTEKYRAKFLLESISDLKQNLNNLNISLIIDFKEIKESFEPFILKYDVDSIYMQREWTRDELIEEESIPKNINKLKVILANEATKIVHGNEASKKAELTAKETFEGKWY